MENIQYDNRNYAVRNKETGKDDSDSLEKKETFVFKFVILGDSNVGKTSILYHYIFEKCNIM
jgi:GTPase SAR1 family protein